MRATQLCDGIWGRTGKEINDCFHQIQYDYLDSGLVAHTVVHDLDIPIADFTFWEAGDLQVLLEERDNWYVALPNG